MTSLGLLGMHPSPRLNGYNQWRRVELLTLESGARRQRCSTHCWRLALSLRLSQ